ncbi:hypothetical protein FIS3754_46070 [Fischerella sp. NIES-3754]|nr:hypothetical protein FIS3754_46070 [Fischerella sp. NIES-3754]BCX11043.1 MAG: hypothetical protein KatS3mg066_4902 [Fischerella sp.]
MQTENLSVSISVHRCLSVVDLSKKIVLPASIPIRHKFCYLEPPTLIIDIKGQFKSFSEISVTSKGHLMLKKGSS